MSFSALEHPDASFFFREQNRQALSFSCFQAFLVSRFNEAAAAWPLRVQGTADLAADIAIKADASLFITDKPQVPGSVFSAVTNRAQQGAVVGKEYVRRGDFDVVMTLAFPVMCTVTAASAAPLAVEENHVGASGQKGQALRGKRSRDL